MGPQSLARLSTHASRPGCCRRAAVTTGSIWAFVSYGFSGYMPRSETVGSYGSFIFSLKLLFMIEVMFPNNKIC